MAGNVVARFSGFGRELVRLSGLSDLLSTIGSASTTAQGVVELATDAEANAASDTTRVITPANLAALTGANLTSLYASTTARGIVEYATDTEANNAASGVRVLTPANLAALTGANLAALGASTTAQGIVELATDAETITGTDTARAVTPAGGAAAFQGLKTLLTNIGNLSMVADRYIYGTGTNTVALGTITAFARSILDDANAATVLTTLGVTADAQLLLADADVPRLSTQNTWAETQTIDTFNAGGSSAGCQIGIVGTTSRVLTSQTGTTPAIHHGFYNFNGLVGTITTNGSATQYNTSSDRRLKDITGDMDIEAARKTIAAIQLREFTWKSSGEPGRGVIADELQEIAPEAVTGGVGDVEEEWAVDAEVRTILRKEDERGLDVVSAEKPDADHLHKLGERISPQGVDYSKLVPDMIGAVQAMMAEIAALKDEVATLKSARLK